MNQQPEILFFSRGRGRGHAVPDLAIVEELQQLEPEWQVTFASYGTGAAFLREKYSDTIDLGLPETNTLLSTMFACRAVIEELRPALVISHEEFAAHPAAKLCGIPSIFLSAWLPQAGNVMAEAISYADAYIITHEPGVFPVPPYFRGRTHYTGPLVRRMRYGAGDRARARTELGLPKNATVVLVTPGGWTETKAPIADTVLAAFQQLSAPCKRLVWQSSDDFALLTGLADNRPDIRVVRYLDPIEQMLVASDVVITKGTCGVTLDAASLGVPTISLSHGLNPVDDIIVPRVRSNTALNAKATNGAILAGYLETLLKLEPHARPAPLPDHGGALATAKIIRDEFRRLAAIAAA